MKSIFQTFFFLALVVVGLGFSAHTIHAQGIVPCGNGLGTTLDGQGFLSDECTLCHLQILAVRFVNFVILLATAFAALLFMNAGFLYVMSPSNPGNISKAHHLFTNTLIGFVILLSSWLIVNLVMTTLIDSGTFGDWKNVLCTSSVQETTGTGIDEIVVNTAAADKVNTDPTAVAPIFYAEAPESGAFATTWSDADVRAALPSNVSTWESAPGKTSFAGLQSDTLDGIKTIANDPRFASGGMVITGAVDSKSTAHTAGTYSHYTGYKVDFDDTPAMNSYIQSSWTPAGTTKSGYPVYTSTINGNPATAVKEGTHWDVKFLPGA